MAYYNIDRNVKLIILLALVIAFFSTSAIQAGA